MSSAGDKIPLPRSLCANHNAHPGIADMPRPKRSPQEVQAEKIAKESKLASRENSRMLTIESTALLEEKMRQEHEEKLNTANNPPRSHLTKKPRPKASDPELNKTPGDADVDDSEIPLCDGVSSDSGDSWGASKEAMEVTDEEDDEDELMDVESEVDSEVGATKTNTRRKKVEKGELRSAVIAAQKPIQEMGTKRKQSLSSQTKPSQKTKKMKGLVISTGFHANWQERLENVDPVGESVQVQSRMPDQRTEDEPVGGISDDGGEKVPTKYFGGKSKANNTTKASPNIIRLRPELSHLHYQIDPVAKIVPTTSVTGFVDSATRTKITSSRIKKEEIRLSHLPSRIQASFDSFFIPRAREIFGYTHPWTFPADDVIEDLWSRCFPLEQGVPDTVALKLIEDRLHSWRNKFAKTAITVLQNDVFPKLPENSKLQRAEWCTWAISNEAHNHPFYYLRYDEDEEGNVKSSGIFQSNIIAAVLATHFSSISTIPVGDRATERPVGALVLTLQAVKRAITMYMTGEKVEQPRPFNNFSKTNWGDSTEIREGRTFNILTTTTLVRVASKLKDKQWDKIIGAARAASKGKKSMGYAPSNDAPMPEDDFEIIDHDSDLAD